jgi:hypothetical protein
MRLVLVHMLARLSRSELAEISEEINKEMMEFEALLGSDRGTIPYRAAVDDILARAVRLLDPPESNEQGDPQINR